jgi:hypothetical protein
MAEIDGRVRQRQPVEVRKFGINDVAAAMPEAPVRESPSKHAPAVAVLVDWIVN